MAQRNNNGLQYNGPRYIEIEGVTYEKQGAGTYWTETNSNKRCLPFVDVDPAIDEKTENFLEVLWGGFLQQLHKDAENFVKTEEEGVWAYKGILFEEKNGQLVLKPNQVFVLKTGFRVSIPYSVNSNGQVFAHCDNKQSVDLAEVRRTIAYNNSREMLSGVVLPSFPLKGELLTMCIDAQAGIFDYQGMRYRHLLEDETSRVDTDDTLQVMFVNEKVQIDVETATYEKIVPHAALYQHFKRTTLAYLAAKKSNNQLTTDDQRVLDVLNDGKVTTFYDFAVRTGAIEPIPELKLLEDERDNAKATAYIASLRNLQIAKVNSAIALHYYMDQVGAEGLPPLKLDGINPHAAYEDMMGKAPRDKDDYYKTWHVSHQSRAGESAAMLYVFGCIQKSPRWQDVAAFQAASFSETDASSRRSWSFLVPPVTHPLYYEDELIEHVKRKTVHLDDNEQALAVFMATATQKYYSSGAYLIEANKALLNYQERMTKALNSQNSQEGAQTNGQASRRIPLYPQSGASHVHQLPQLRFYQNNKVEATAALDTNRHIAVSAATEQQLITGGLDTATVIASMAIKPVGAIMTLGVTGFVPGLIVGAAVFGAAHYAYSYISQKIYEGKIEDATRITREVTHNINMQRINIAGRLADLSERPQAKAALEFVYKKLKDKKDRTPDEEMLFKYLDAEIKNPGRNTFGEVDYMPEALNVPGDDAKTKELKKATREQKNAFDEFAKVHAEASIYSYCLNVYYANEQVREQDSELYNTTRKEMEDEASQERLSRVVGENKKTHFTVSNYGGKETTGFSAVLEKIIPTDGNTTHSNFVATRVQERMDHFSPPKNPRSVNVVLPGNVSNVPNTVLLPMADEGVLLQGYRARYSREAMRSLSKVWVGEKCSAEMPNNHCGAATNIALSQTENSNENALFYSYSFGKSRETQIQTIKAICQARCGAGKTKETFLSEEEKKIYKLLTARKANKESPTFDERKYDRALTKLKRLDSNLDVNNEASIENTVFALRVEHLYLTLKGAKNSEEESRLQELETALNEYDSVTEPKITSYAQYQKAINPGFNFSCEQEHLNVQGESQSVYDGHQYNTSVNVYPQAVAWNMVRDDIQAMGEESFDFLAGVQAYFLSGHRLKGSVISANLTGLFLSRDERIKKAQGNPTVLKNLEQEFLAEKEICDDIFAVFQEAVKQSKELQEVCKRNGWLDADGKLVPSKIYNDPNLDDKSIKHQADVAEKKCCMILRAIESDRHVAGQSRNILSGLFAPNDLLKVNLTKESFEFDDRKMIYQNVYDGLMEKISAGDNFDAFISILAAKKMVELYGSTFSSNPKSDQERIEKLIKKKGWGKYITSYMKEKDPNCIPDITFESCYVPYLCIVVDKKIDRTSPDKISPEVEKEIDAILTLMDEKTLQEVLNNDSLKLIKPLVAKELLSKLIDTHIDLYETPPKISKEAEKAIKETLTLMDEKTLQAVLNDELLKPIKPLIENQLKALNDPNAKGNQISAVHSNSDEGQVSTSATERLALNAEQNITTIQENDGVGVSYPSSRGRA